MDMTEHARTCTQTHTGDVIAEARSWSHARKGHEPRNAVGLQKLENTFSLKCLLRKPSLLTPWLQFSEMDLQFLISRVIRK